MEDRKETAGSAPANEREAREAATAFARRWWKLLVCVFVVAATASLGVSFIIKPLYRSTAVMIPTNSNRLTKAIMDYHYSMDFMDYGAERDCEYAIQIMTSKSMRDAVCRRFNLMDHYRIKPTAAHRQHTFEKKWESLTTVRRTKYMAIEVSVLDTDPQMAADIANYMLAVYDTLCRGIHANRAASAAEVMETVCAAAEAELDSLSATATAKGGWRDQLVKRKCKKLAEMQTRAIQTSAERGIGVTYKYIIDKAVAADKKDRPKRALIVLAGSLGAVVVCTFALLLFVPRKEETD